MRLAICIRRSMYVGLAAWLAIPHHLDHGWAQNRDADLETLKRQMEVLSQQNSRAEIERLQRQIEQLQQREAERQRQIEELQRQIKTLESRSPVVEKPAEPDVSPLDKALQDIETEPIPPDQTAQRPRQVGGPRFRLIDISAVINVAAGGSTVNDEQIRLLQGGFHDPNRNGFTLQALELSFAGAVDPYFTGEAHVAFSSDPDGDIVTELEEAFVTTQSLPYGLEVEGGLFLTELGITNPAHTHEWDWMDQPVINTRIFGPDGMRQVGMRVGWLAPLPWYSQFHVGIQNANGVNMPSFCGEFIAGGEHTHEGGGEEEGMTVGQRPFFDCEVDSPDKLVYLLRWENAWEMKDTVTTKFGLSSLFGPNASDPDPDGNPRTIVAGADLKLLWRPDTNFRGWPFLEWQTEFVWRQFDAAEVPDLGLPSDTLYDWGLYTHLLWGFAYRWAAGVRFEYADGSGNSVEGRSQDPFRGLRYRTSPLVAFYLSEFSRLRLQYNLDWADHLNVETDSNWAHTIWLGLEVLYGAHPPHKY